VVEEDPGLGVVGEGISLETASSMPLTKKPMSPFAKTAFLSSVRW
jgi:hypothetical protein